MRKISLKVVGSITPIDDARPVISFNARYQVVKPDDLEANLIRRVKSCAVKNKVEIETGAPEAAFESLIANLHKKSGKRVSVLTGECDAPMLSKIDNPKEADKIRGIMGGFYSALKGGSSSIDFIFITGASRFARTSIFQGLDDLEDMTLDDKHADIRGLTTPKFDLFFESQTPPPDPAGPSSMPPVMSAMTKNGLPPVGAAKADFRELVLNWYDGHAWDGETRLSNPWSAFNLFRKMKFNNYWFMSGSPTFLTKGCPKDFDAREIFKEGETLDDDGTIIEIENIDPPAPLFQAGCLTVDKIMAAPGRKKKHTFKPPDREVVDSHARLAMVGRNGALDNFLEIRQRSDGMLAAPVKRDSKTFENAFSAPLANIPRGARSALEKHLRQALLFAFGFAGKRHEAETMSVDGSSDVLARPEDGTGFVIRTTHVPDGDPAAREERPDGKMAKLMGTASKKAMSQTEHGKLNLKFKGDGDKFKGGGNDIFKMALIACGHGKASAVFERGPNWTPAPDQAGRHEAEKTEAAVPPAATARAVPRGPDRSGSGRRRPS
ncbi:MAG: AAA family ATPase [Deltaproteobacteria bacterium]|jgi:hypothetical protein|nr:AAA family ATPase [Deltaproteobacteria bacterium]